MRRAVVPSCRRIGAGGPRRAAPRRETAYPAAYPAYAGNAASVSYGA